jgi:phosphodiester glycosidase
MGAVAAVRAIEREPIFRPRLRDGRTTTVHVARFPIAKVRVRVAHLDPPERLEAWCARHGVADAMIGGFFIRAEGVALGVLRIGGRDSPHVPFTSPWGSIRSCVHATEEGVALASRSDLPAEPPGDLLQAGPMLVADGRSQIREGADPEGFSAGSGQFDSDITAGSHPRAALGLGGGELIAAVCDGRAGADAGLTLTELAETMLLLGAERAINLDGGGSASLVTGGRLRNRPREEHGVALSGGRPISTALMFAPR